jgi:S1-C subfamily serine protease
MKSRWLLGLFFFIALSVPLRAYPGDEPHYSFDRVKTALANIPISQGPDASKLTRSSTGPQLYRNTVDAVVLIYLPGETPGTGVSGSGVVVTALGHIFTNWHVIRDNEYALVIFRPKPPKTMADIAESDMWVARNLGTIAKKDIGLLQLVGPISKAKNISLSFLKTIPLADPLSVEVGQDVYAIGHPEGLFWSYTEGVISQIRPRYKWQADEDLFEATVVQTQTAISHGSSGGPLINKEGKLVGMISSMIIGPAGFNFAIAVQELSPLLRP